MKKLLFFLMLTLLCIPWATRAQNAEFTLFEEETGNFGNYACPVWGDYLGKGTCATEFIIPAEYLNFLEGARFSKMTFYIHEYYLSNSPQVNVAWNVPYKVYLSETEATSFRNVSDTIGRASATLVFYGRLNANRTTSEMAVLFDTPYEYHGGNLVVGFWQSGSSESSGAPAAVSFTCGLVEDTVYLGRIH